MKNRRQEHLDSKKRKLLFTGERMIPELNKGKTLYYEHLLRYLFSSQFVKHKKVLDLGCGSGYGSRILKALGAKEVFGVDISKEAVEYARSTYGNQNVKFLTADVEKLPLFKERFDTIAAFEILEHLQNHNSFLKGIKKNLKPDGIFLVSTPNKYTYPEKNPFHLKELFPDQFETLLKEYFTYVHLFNQQFLFSNSIQPQKRHNNLDLNFIHEKYIKENRVSINPNIKIKESRYLIAVCSNKPIKNVNSYSLDSFQTDEFSLRDGIEGLSRTIMDEIKARLENDEDKKELQRAFNEITSSKFYRFWQFYCKCRDFFKKKFLGKI